MFLFWLSFGDFNLQSIGLSLQSYEVQNNVAEE
jgi:hypothetical protein